MSKVSFCPHENVIGTERVIFGPWYKVDFVEDNFAIHVNWKFTIQINSKISFVKFATLGTKIRGSIFHKDIFPSCTLKFVSNKCGRAKLLERVLRKSGKVLCRVLKE